MDNHEEFDAIMKEIIDGLTGNPIRDIAGKKAGSTITTNWAGPSPRRAANSPCRARRNR